MNGYLVTIYYNTDARKQPPKQVWLKAESIQYLEKVLKEKIGVRLRKLEVLQVIKNI